MENQSLTIEGAGQGLTVLDGGDLSQVLNISMPLFRGQGSSDTTTNVYVPDFKSVDSDENGIVEGPDGIENEVIAEITRSAAFPDDAEATITVRNLAIQRGFGELLNLTTRDAIALTAAIRCGWLLDGEEISLYFENNCAGGGLSIDVNNADVVIDGVAFKDNEGTEFSLSPFYTNEVEGAGLSVSVVGGDITVTRSTFEGNIAKHDYAHGGAARLVSRYGNVTVTDSVFGGTERTLGNTAVGSRQRSG